MIRILKTPRCMQPGLLLRKITATLERVTACGQPEQTDNSCRDDGQQQTNPKTRAALRSGRVGARLQSNASLSTRFEAHPSHTFKLRSGPAGRVFSVHKADDIITSHKWFLGDTVVLVARAAPTQQEGCRFNSRQGPRWSLHVLPVSLGSPASLHSAKTRV